ncbi:MAG TPA: TlpA disulfide reductase family protein [Gemmatimonadaceae bacterium]|nr:TlpA disulfide reductase family protein [Gemmatimonadaceae bacterium]
MTARTQWGIVLGVVLLLVGGLVAATHFLGDELYLVSVGSAAPDFHGATLPERGTPVVKHVADYRGQVVLLNVWATWCAPCRVEMPSIQALHETYGPAGLKVVALSIDDAGQESAIRAFAKQLGLTFEILHDPSGDVQKVYQTTGVPETFVIGPDGVIRKKVIGAADWNSPANRALVEQLLADARRYAHQ